MTLMAVLGRPTNPIPDEEVKWCFHLIVAVRSGCQLATAAAHAGERPMFWQPLLKAMSIYVRTFLDDAVRTLEA